MSLKDVRDLAEHLKLLGFPKAFPLQALSTTYGSLAGFRVVSEILQWLASLLEPGTVLPGNSESEKDRILLICSATEFFVTKSAIKLNPRKLYAASTAAAMELQKITKLLITPPDDDGEKDEEESYRSGIQIDITNKTDELRRARELSSDLSIRGAVLYDLLTKEIVNKEARQAQTNRPMELASVERTIKNAIASAQVKLQSSKAQLENSRIEMNALNSKVQRKKAELERTKQRLEALQRIRPAHMQEFEECEQELQKLFQQYFQRIHVRDALKAQLAARTKKVSPISSPLSQKPGDTSMPFIPEGLMEDEEDDDELGLGNDINFHDQIHDNQDEDIMLRNTRSDMFSEASVRSGTATSRIRPTTGRRQKPASGSTIGRHKVIGRMFGDHEHDIDDDSTFGSTESDGDIDGGDGFSISNIGETMIIGAEPQYDLNSEEEISITKITGDLPLRPKTASKPDHHSDEDF